MWGAMEIYGKGGTLYGHLEHAAGGGAVLKCDGNVVMTLEAAQDDLQMTASSPSGALLATAGKNVQFASKQMESHDTWKLQVKPGVDALLVASTMLSLMLFTQ